MTDFKSLTAFKLAAGGHVSPERGLCAMEAVAWLEGLPHSDEPNCTCPVISSFVRTINDLMPSAVRQLLIPYLPRLVGTVARQHEPARARWLARNAVAMAVRHWNGDRAAAELARFLQSDTPPPEHVYVWLGAKSGEHSDAGMAATYAHRSLRGVYGVKRDYKYAASNAAFCAARCAALSARYAFSSAEGEPMKTVMKMQINRALKNPQVWKHAFEMLDGVLAIGPTAAGFSGDTEARAAADRALVKA